MFIIPSIFKHHHHTDCSAAPVQLCCTSLLTSPGSLAATFPLSPLLMRSLLYFFLFLESRTDIFLSLTLLLLSSSFLKLFQLHTAHHSKCKHSQFLAGSFLGITLLVLKNSFMPIKDIIFGIFQSLEANFVFL